jgi:hypothetical protein
VTSLLEQAFVEFEGFDIEYFDMLHLGMGGIDQHVVLSRHHG